MYGKTLKNFQKQFSNMNWLLIFLVINIPYYVFSSRVVCKWDTYVYATTDGSKVALTTVKETDFTGCEDLVFDGFLYDPDTQTFTYTNYQSPGAENPVIEDLKQANVPNHIITFNSIENYDSYIVSLKDTQMPVLMKDFLKQNCLQGVLLQDWTKDTDTEIFKSFLKNAYGILNAEGLLVYTTLKNDVKPMEQLYIDLYVQYSANSDLLLMRGCYPPLDEKLLMNLQSINGANGCFGDGCAIASVIKQLQDAKVDVKKLALPIATFCVGYKLLNAPTNCIGTPIDFQLGPIWQTEYSFFFEACYCQQSKTFGQDTIFSCTDRPLAAEIAQYAIKIGAGGINIDSLNYEDAKGSLCKCGEAFPIKNTVITVINGGDGSNLTPCLDSAVNPTVAPQCCGSPPPP